MNGLEEKISREFIFKTSRSGGKGGQHVNKTESKVELLFHIASSFCLTPEEKNRLIEKLANKTDSEGYFHLYESSERSQHANKEKLIKKALAVIAQALKVKKKRVKTKVSKAVKARIRKMKEMRSDIKKLRKKANTIERR